jgi:hypothetical protein
MKYKMSSLVTEATGKIGGMVAMGSGSGGVMRVKYGARLKAGFWLSFQKNLNMYVTRSWKNLSDAQRSVWLKTTYKELSGFQLFLHVNLKKRSYPSALVLNCPVFKACTNVNIIAATINSSAQTLVIVFSNLLAANEAYVIYLSQPMSAGVSVFKRKLLYIRQVNNPSSTTVSTPMSSQVLFKVKPYAGAKYQLQICAKNITTEVTSSIVNLFIIAT